MRTIQEQNLVSVVIPTLNAAEHLPRALAPLAGSRLVREVIVSDAGSDDGTALLATAAGARVVTGPRGRGLQLAAGAAAASGPWLLFLHADGVLPQGWEEPVAALITAPNSARRAGYFAFALDDDRAAARCLEWLVAWRCRLFALPYGDQGLLIARELYEAVGGFAPLPLMEDVDLVCRLGRRRLTAIGAAVTSSAGRYRRDGYLRRPLRNLCCLALYFAGLPPARVARLYG